MNRRRFLTRSATGTAAAVAMTAGLAGFAGCLGTSDDEGRLDLTVQNEGDAPVEARVVVTGADGSTYADETDTVDPGVARAFEVTVATTGRHEVVASGEEWEGALAWDAERCALYDGTVRVAGDRVAVAGECAEPR
ncbi:hypothetical protein [Haloparvum sedimenti]|uniref:hypothetical protein n=1 Tax=Haloparvum sedimenti TaxID=1678448 RepID=UPI00071E6944|nr:hypothetical protein [Haloparvum sedimenti]